MEFDYNCWGASSPTPIIGRIKVAGWFWSRMLGLLGAEAITMPWCTIYVLVEYRWKRPTLIHEMAHVGQIERDGWLWFSLQYLWWSWHYGYWGNPYEVEAYEHETRANDL